MPDPEDREKLEAGIVAALVPLFQSHRFNAPTDQPDILFKVDTGRLQREAEAELEPLLIPAYYGAWLAMFGTSTRTAAGRKPGEAMESPIMLAAGSAAAIANAKHQSATVAHRMAHNIQRELDAGRDIATVLSPNRAESIAATEITRVITRGETAARRTLMQAGQSAEQLPPGIRSPLDLGDGLIPFWITAGDGLVCSICSPLDNRPIEAWGWEVPAGPPAHPFCRCWLDYRRKIGKTSVN